MSVISLQEWLKKQEKISTLQKSQSKPNLKSEQTGQTHIKFDPEFDPDDPVVKTLRDIWATLDRTHKHPYMTKSRFARYHADYIGLCASEGWITTKKNSEVWGNKWFITPKGISAMEQLEVYSDD